MHVPIAHRGEGLDAEKERARKTGRIQVRDAAGHQMVEPAEKQVENKEERHDRGEELRPAHRHEMVIEILEDSAFDDLCDHFARTDPDAAQSDWAARAGARLVARRLRGVGF